MVLAILGSFIMGFFAAKVVQVRSIDNQEVVYESDRSVTCGGDSNICPGPDL